MDILFEDFHRAQLHGSGPLLASTLEPVTLKDDQSRLRRISLYSDRFSIQSDLRSGLFPRKGSLSLSKAEAAAWVDIYVAYWRAVCEIVSLEEGGRGNWVTVYDAWKDVANALIKGYSSGGFLVWTIPCLYTTGKYLRIFAIKADQTAISKGMTFGNGMAEDIAGDFEKNEKLEDAARVINRIFTLCISDRAPLQESRKWGLYYTTNLLFKTYFKLNSINLCKNILRAIQASSGDMPAIEMYPKSHVCTFHYYVGVTLFLEENYAKAEEYLTTALNLCHKDTVRNRELILTYLIPTHLLTTHTLPTEALLSPYSFLRSLFTPVISAIKAGDIAAFDAALSAGEPEFVKRRIYLTLERGRDIAMRNLFRKVFLAGGFVEEKESESLRRTRVPIDEFVAAVRLGTRGRVDGDEVECMLANMIYKNLIKGYIARERGMVVLSKGGAFPGTGV